MTRRLADTFTNEGFRQNLILKILIAAVLLTAGSLMFPHPESFDYSYGVGGVWADQDLVAPFSFPIFKELRQYEQERQEAAHNVYAVFERRDDITRYAGESLKVLMKSIQRAAAARSRWLRSRFPADSAAFARAGAIVPTLLLSEADWNVLVQMNERSPKVITFSALEASILETMASVGRAGLIDQPKIRQPHLARLALRKGTAEDVIPYDNVFDTEEALNLILSRLQEETIRTVAAKIAREVLKPNIIFNQSQTRLAIQLAEDDVPRTLGYVRENERIVGKDDRITEEVKIRLDSFRKAKAERGSGYAGWRHWAGTTLHVAILITLYTLYLYLFRKRVFRDNGKLLLIALLLIMEMFFAYLSLNLGKSGQYLIFVPAASMLLSIIFDSRVAFYGTVTIAFLIAGIRGNDYPIALISLAAGVLSVYTVRDIRHRTQIFRSIIFIFLGYLIPVIALSLEMFESFSSITTDMTFALANAVFSPVLTYGLLIFFERAFRVTTDLTLVELSDFNHPLLRDLSEKAPGTFHHSITIGNLAEAAAEEVGANPILARVGGYYHDIGKMVKPEYFVENQIGNQNRHSRLKPRMSALIIASHVKEGIELGRQNGLPEIVLDFIPQHHGTTRISFFYDKALRQAVRRPTKEIIQEEDFLYPGPKPQTKELGIVMLADSVEASTRAIQEMTPQKLEASIDNMIKHRFLEGQLDECELTLKDLAKIKEAFLKILTGIHHQRIKYPESQPGAAAEQKQVSPEAASVEKPVQDLKEEALKKELPAVEASAGTGDVHISDTLRPEQPGSDTTGGGPSGAAR